MSDRTGVGGEPRVNLFTDIFNDSQGGIMDRISLFQKCNFALKIILILAICYSVFVFKTNKIPFMVEKIVINDVYISDYQSGREFIDFLKETDSNIEIHDINIGGSTLGRKDFDNNRKE